MEQPLRDFDFITNFSSSPLKKMVSIGGRRGGEGVSSGSIGGEKDEQEETTS